MKYKATVLSAGGLPGLGQLICGRCRLDRLKGVLFIILTILPIVWLLLSLFQSILNALPPAHLLPQDINSIFKLSWEIKDKIVQSEKPKFILALGIIIPVWLLSIWDAFRLDRNSFSSAPSQ